MSVIVCQGIEEIDRKEQKKNRNEIQSALTIWHILQT